MPKRFCGKKAKEVATTSLYILKRWELRNNYVIRRTGY